MAQVFKLASGQGHIQVLRPSCRCGDEGQVDFCLVVKRELFFSFFSRFTQPLCRHFVLSQVDALRLSKLIRDVLDENLINVVPA